MTTISENKTIKINLATILLLAVILLPTIYLAVQGKFARQSEMPAVAPAPRDMALAERVHLANTTPSYNNYFELGFAYNQKKMFHEAISAYQKAIALNSTSARAYNNLGVAYGELGMWVDQIAASKKALELDPRFELAKNNLAWAQSKLPKDKN